MELLLELLLAQIESSCIIQLIEINVIVLVMGFCRTWRVHAQIFGLCLLGHITCHVHDLWRWQPEYSPYVLRLAPRIATAMSIYRAGAIFRQIEWCILVQAALRKIHRLLRTTVAGTHRSELICGGLQGGGSYSSRCHRVIPAHGWRKSWRWWRLNATFVVHQVVAPAELHMAAIALKRLFAIVHQHVGLELVGITELAIADLTGIRALPSVDTEMASQVGHLNELAITVGAVIWFLTRMQTHVCLQVMIPCEALVAFGALEGLLAGVCALMILQDVLVAKAAGADLAGEALVPGGILCWS